MSNFVRRLQRVGAEGSTIVVPEEPSPTGRQIYLAPPSGNFSVGENIVVQVRIDSEDQIISAYHANISYPQGRLTRVSTSLDGSPFPTTMQNVDDGGLVRIGAGVMGAGNEVSGDVLVATITFTVTAAGSAPLVFESGTGFAYAGTDYCEYRNGAEYTLA